MTVRGVIEYKGLHPGNTLSELRRAVKSANFEAIDAWHTSFLPDHFKRGAGKKYGYDPRSFQYLKQKRKKFGHNIDLVYTGVGSDRAKRMIKITGTSKSAKGRLPGTQVFNFRRNPGSPDMRTELLRVLDSEAAVLAKVHELSVVRYLNSIKKTKKVRA